MAFAAIAEKLSPRIIAWEKYFLGLYLNQVTASKNKQNRSIKQIIGHMVDSTSNNTHRAIHLQYGKSPLNYPNYATYGNNDKWIEIQNYQNEDWHNLVKLWKYSHLHFLHVISNINNERLDRVWLADKDELVTLKEMVDDFPRHFELHISEIEELLNRK
jgi:hypothetical protein